MQRSRLVGVSGVVVIVWSIASIVAVGVWNAAKLLVMGAGRPASSKGVASPLASSAPRRSVDAV